MTFTWYVPFLAALIPMIIGFIWYNPKVLGTAWMTASGMTPEKAKGANMGLVFGLAYLLSVMLAMALIPLTIHQSHMFSILANEPGVNDPSSEIGMFLKGFLEKYGHNFRTFKHGAFHGTLAAFFISLPILGTNALFERKSFKYVAINVGYWMLTMALMGGVVCAFL
ncbi:MAG TPA: DUF1761 domain-containing protein [Bacteroidia bacterium]|jgi:hypothetical protein|nr:DUF1761 domain-containing protein [Bacteroidia bacterium]